MNRCSVVQVCAVCALGLALVAPVRAQPSMPPEVAPDAQQRAEVLFAEGSTLYQQWQFVHAEQKYREALMHWEHPVIYLYLSRTLEKQGHLEGSYKTLQQALRRDPELLSQEDAEVADELQTSLKSRLAQIEVHCAETNAEILLDGVSWFITPGPQRGMIRPGQHVIIARKAGYFPVTEVVTLLPGKQTRVDVHMTVDEIRVERRWQRWKPWTIVGGGMATSLLGGVLLRQAVNDYAAFRRALTVCEGQFFCNQVSIRRRDSGTWKDAVGTGTLIIGSTAAVIGLAGVLLNQVRAYRSEPMGDVKFEFAPLASFDGPGVSAQFSF